MVFNQSMFEIIFHVEDQIFNFLILYFMEGILKQVGPKLYVDQNKLLGRGSTGDVYEGVFLSPSPQPVAVKIIPLSEINNEVTAYLLQC